MGYRACNRVPGEEGVAGFADVVDSDHVRSLGGDGDGDSDRSERALFHRAAEDFGQESLAGMADQDWASEVSQGSDVRKQLDIVLCGFAEADARICGDSFSRDAGLFQCDQSVGEETANVADDVVVVRVSLHGLGGSQNMHADDAAV